MSGVNACIFAGVVEYPRHRARPTLTPRARMWGVVFRIAAAAAAIAVVQHHVTQVYEAWRADDDTGPPSYDCEMVRSPSSLRKPSTLVALRPQSSSRLISLRTRTTRLTF